MNIQNKTIFDLLHGYIEIDSEAIKIIDCKEFQRLRNIKQLGVVHLVFPSATHTRFEHSLGVYHLCSDLVYFVFTFIFRKRIKKSQTIRQSRENNGCRSWYWKVL